MSKKSSIKHLPSIHLLSDKLNQLMAADGSNNLAENSNSSSDFNFLSNLANDFAPEYYQLS